MTKFLEKTAQYVLEKHAGQMQDICIVLPNRRGGLFLKQYLSAAAGKTIWSPAIFSVEDFFSSISGLHLISLTEQLFELFEVHRESEEVKENKKEEEKNIKFDEFLGWGPQMLHDFGETDSYLVDADQLFHYLSESKAISLWNPGGKPLTEFEKKYLSFYNSLDDYYKKYRERLAAGGKAYPGMLFRDVADRIGSIQIPWKKIIVAGMNALTTAEEKVYNHLYREGLIEFLWDADEYYVSDHHQEAGRFIRGWMKKWPEMEFNWLEDHFRNEKQILISGIPDDLGQVKYCGQLLKELLEKKVPAEEIAIVLPDEQLLVPLLNSIPPEVENINVTMGLPLRFTPLYTFFDLLFQLHLNVPRFRREGDKSSYRFYFRDILAILHHPYISSLTFDSNLPYVSSLTRTISSGSHILYEKDQLFGSESDLFNTPPDFMELIFHPWNRMEDVFTCLKGLTGKLLDLFSQSRNSHGPAGHDLDVEYLFTFSQIIHQMEVMHETYHAFDSPEILFKLFLQLAGAVKLPFYGEPLKGVQVMGMLETRSLDFKHLIVLSVNEGILPSGKTNNSFIPFEIKRNFGLPTYLNNNSIYAYHFYRMIQYPATIHLLYNSTGDKLGGGEKSRFINQLLHELPTHNPAIQLENGILSSTPPPWKEPEKLEIQKDGKVLQKLLERGQKGISPTQLNAYRQCPMKFYFSDIAGIRKPEELEETIDNGKMGSVIHEILKEIFEPLKDQLLSAEGLKKHSSDIDVLLNKSFRNNVPGCDVRSGKNLLIWNVAKMLVQRLIRSEMERAESGEELTVKFLEEWFERPLKIAFGSEFLEIRLRGKIDRIDQCKGGWMVLDYKTGKFETRDIRINDWEDLKSSPALEKGFQLLLYSWMFHPRVVDSCGGLFAGIISLKNQQNGVDYVEVPGGKKKDLSDSMGDFGRILEEILKEMFDVAKPFVQVEDLKVCRWCDYTNLCCR